MTMTTALVDVGSAQITRDGYGIVTVDDPGSPILIRIRVDSTARIVELTVVARHPTARISAASLSRLPIAQIRHVAAAAAAADALWHATTSPKPAGTRSWGPGHWEEVMDVYEWAVSTNRPGGGAQAISDLWHVTKNPTAYRWIKQAIEKTGREVSGHIVPPR